MFNEAWMNNLLTFGSFFAGLGAIALGVFLIIFA